MGGGYNYNIQCSLYVYAYAQTYNTHSHNSRCKHICKSPEVLHRTELIMGPAEMRSHHLL